jgi:hypothetical protein
MSLNLGPEKERVFLFCLKGRYHLEDLGIDVVNIKKDTKKY